MIVVRLIGGLGNQLFQYAAGRRLAYEREVSLKLDLSGFSAYRLRSYALEPFAIQATMATSEDLARITARSQRAKFGQILQRATGFGLGQIYKERSFRFDPAVLEIRPPALLDGYWQSEKYFSSIAHVIRRELTIRSPLAKDNLDAALQIEHCQSVSVHIRRGDYVTNPETMKVHGHCSLDYYERATQLIAARVRQPVFFVFSDDPAWVHSHFKLPFPTVVVDHNFGKQDHEDLRLMSLCQHHILANSSFSWWGAWLNPREDKIVVAPARWFNALDHDTVDLLPESWIGI